MIYIDAREGVSGDMLVAAMLGLLEEKPRRDASDAIGRAASLHKMSFSVSAAEDGGEKGLMVTYALAEPSTTGVSHDDAFALLEEMEGHLGSRSSVGRLILRAIFEAESEAHGAPVEQVHLHEIGRPQAILNMAAIGFLSKMLVEDEDDGFVCSTIVTGRGITVVSHGAVRIPPPAARVLLRGLWHEEGDASGERATPTGIAAVKVLAKTQSDMLPLNHYIKRSVGFGTKRFGGRLGRTALYLH